MASTRDGEDQVATFALLGTLSSLGPRLPQLPPLSCVVVAAGLADCQLRRATFSVSDFGGGTGWRIIGPEADIGYQVQANLTYQLSMLPSTFEAESWPARSPAPRKSNDLKAKFDNAQSGARVGPGQSRVPLTSPGGTPTLASCFQFLPAAVAAGSRAAQMAQQEQGPHAVVYVDANKKIMGTQTNNDGFRWGHNSKRNVQHHEAYKIKALSSNTDFIVKATGQQRKQQVMDCKCLGEWECKNPECKLEASTGVLGKFHMKKEDGSWKCNGPTGSGCGSLMCQVAECPAHRFRISLAPVDEGSADSVAYVYTGGHATTCQMPEPTMLSDVAIGSMPSNVSPAVAVVQACNSLALAATLGGNGPQRGEALAALREMHNNPDMAKRVAIDKAAVGRNKTKLGNMTVDRLVALLFENTNETIVAYHNEWDCNSAWKGTVLIEGIVKNEKERMVMAARPNWKFSQVHHLLAMSDDGRVLALLDAGLVERMQGLHYHFDSEHPDVVLGLYSHNSCTYDPQARELVCLCRCISATETAVDLIEARKAMDVALRRHLSVLDPNTDWSGFCFRPRIGTVLDEGYAGVNAFKAPEESGQASVGCQMHFSIDLERRAKLIGGQVGAQFQRLVAEVFLRAVLPEAFAVSYIRLLDWLKTAKLEVQQRRDVAFYLAFWLWPPRCRRVATAFQAYGPKSQLVEILHAQTQALGRKGLGLIQAIFFDTQFCMAQTASRARHFLSGHVRPGPCGAGPIAKAATLAAQAKARQAASLVFCSTHRHDKSTLQQQIKSGLIYATKPGKGEIRMQGISCVLPADNHTMYRIILPEGQTHDVASECVSAADKTHWELMVNGQPTAHVFPTRADAPDNGEPNREQRWRTSSSGGRAYVRTRSKSSVHATNVLKKSQSRGSVEVLGIQWEHKKKVELLLLFTSTPLGSGKAELKQHIVTLGHEPMCSCMGMCQATSPDKYGITTMCSHYVGCLQDVLGVEGNHLCRQVALTTSELEPLLSTVECLAVDEPAQKRWELDMESKKAEGGRPALCSLVVDPLCACQWSRRKSS